MRQFDFNLEIYDQLLELISDSLPEENTECEEYLKITFGKKNKLESHLYYTYILIVANHH